MEDQFELTILDSGDQTRVIAMARCGFDMAIESFSGLQLQKFFDFHMLLSATAGGKVLNWPTLPELAKFGRDLFTLIVRGDIEKIYTRLPKSHIRLQIYSNRPDLQAIPWEYIQEPDCVPGPNAHRSVVRVVPTIGVQAPVPKKLDAIVRMLFVYAEPRGSQAWTGRLSKRQSKANSTHACRRDLNSKLWREQPRSHLWMRFAT